MNRIIGLTVALVVPLSVATTAHAQATNYGGVPTGPDYGAAVMAGQPYGGFGLQYSPGVPAGGMVVDQWGGLHPVGYANSGPVAVVQPENRVVLTRPRSRRMMAQPRYQLPTGSLEWSGGNGGMLYSPGTRYASYGSGYSVGPYGVIDHRMMWKW